MTIDDLLDAIRQIRAVSPEVALWDNRMCGEYLVVSPRHFMERIASLPGFPAAILLPSEGGKPRRRWPAKEVIAWAGRQRERRAAA